MQTEDVTQIEKQISALQTRLNQLLGKRGE